MDFKSPIYTVLHYHYYTPTFRNLLLQVRKDKGGAGYKSMGGGGGKSNGNAAQPSRLTMSRLEQVFMMERMV